MVRSRKTSSRSWCCCVCTPLRWYILSPALAAFASNVLGSLIVFAALKRHLDVLDQEAWEGRSQKLEPLADEVHDLGRSVQKLRRSLTSSASLILGKVRRLDGHCSDSRWRDERHRHPGRREGSPFDYPPPYVPPRGGQKFRDPVHDDDEIDDEKLRQAISLVRRGLSELDELTHFLDHDEDRGPRPWDGPQDTVLGEPCRDVASTGLGSGNKTFECRDLEKQCKAGAPAEAVQALCPVTCGKCSRPCEDAGFTTFTEDDGRMSRCRDLKHMCEEWETRERLRRICPVTCNVCPGLIEDPEDALHLVLRNHTKALAEALRRSTKKESQSRQQACIGEASGTELARATWHEGLDQPWRIPQVLHQTWKTDALPAKFEEEVASWRRLHPHWQFEFWDDRRGRDLVFRLFPEYLIKYDRMSGIKRADVVRLVALHAYGGVYADIDVEASRNFDDLLDASAAVRAGVLLGEENAVHTVLLERRASGHFVSNAVMASTPGHPFWLEVLDTIFDKTKECGSDPVLCTGPRLIDRVSFAYAQRHTDCGRKGCLVRLPFEYFSPHIARWNAGSMVESCGRLLTKLPEQHKDKVKTACRRLEQTLAHPAALQTAESFAVHHWQCSWCRDDPALRRSIPLHEVIWRVGNETLRSSGCQR